MHIDHWGDKMRLINAEVIEEDGTKFIVSHGKRWGIEIYGRRRYFKATVKLRNGDIRFTSAIMDKDEAKWIAEILNELTDDEVATVRASRKRGWVEIDMTPENGKFYA